MYILIDIHLVSHGYTQTKRRKESSSFIHAIWKTLTEMQATQVVNLVRGTTVILR